MNWNDDGTTILPKLNTVAAPTLRNSTSSSSLAHTGLAGSFTLTYGLKNISVLWNETAAGLKAKLTPLTDGAKIDDVTGAGTTASPWLITFNDKVHPALSVGASTLTRGITSVTGTGSAASPWTFTFAATPHAPLSVAAADNHLTRGVTSVTAGVAGTDLFKYKIVFADVAHPLLAMGTVAGTATTPGSNRLLRAPVRAVATTSITDVSNGKNIWTDAVAGSFTLTLGAGVTTVITLDPDADMAAVIKAALKAVPTEGAKVVEVTGTGIELDPWRVLFNVPAASVPALIFTVAGNKLVKDSIVKVRTTPGVPPVPAIYRLYTNAASGTFTLNLTAGRRTGATTAIQYNASASATTGEGLETMTGKLSAVLKTFLTATQEAEVDVAGKGTAAAPWYIMFANPYVVTMTAGPTTDLRISGGSFTFLYEEYHPQLSER